MARDTIMIKMLATGGKEEEEVGRGRGEITKTGKKINGGGGGGTEEVETGRARRRDRQFSIQRLCGGIKAGSSPLTCHAAALIEDDSLTARTHKQEAAAQHFTVLNSPPKKSSEEELLVP